MLRDLSGNQDISKNAEPYRQGEAWVHLQEAMEDPPENIIDVSKNVNTLESSPSELKLTSVRVHLLI